MVDYFSPMIHPRQRLPFGPYRPEMRSSEPSWTDQLAGTMSNWFADQYSKFSGELPTNVARRQMTEEARQGLEATQVLPAADVAREGWNAAREGNYAQAAKAAGETAVNLFPPEKLGALGVKGAGIFMSPLLLRDKGIINWFRGGKSVGTQGSRLIEKAADMLKRGRSEQEVLQETGISYARGSGIDEQYVPQIEISTRDMELNPDFPSQRMLTQDDFDSYVAASSNFKKKYPRLGDVVDAPTFFKTGPATERLQKIPFFRDESGLRVAGLGSNRQGQAAMITMRPDYWDLGPRAATAYGTTEKSPMDTALNVVAHEIGHGVQAPMRKKGWSSESDFTGFEDIAPSFYNVMPEHEQAVRDIWQRYYAQQPSYPGEWMPSSPAERAYFDSPAEIQARIGAARVGFDEKAMRSIHPQITSAQEGWVPRANQWPSEVFHGFKEVWDTLAPDQQAAYWRKMLQGLQVAPGPGIPIPPGGLP